MSEINVAEVTANIEIYRKIFSTMVYINKQIKNVKHNHQINIINDITSINNIYKTPYNNTDYDNLYIHYKVITNLVGNIQNTFLYDFCTEHLQCDKVEKILLFLNNQEEFMKQITSFFYTMQNKAQQQNEIPQKEKTLAYVPTFKHNIYLILCQYRDGYSMNIAHKALTDIEHIIKIIEQIIIYMLCLHNIEGARITIKDVQEYIIDTYNNIIDVKYAGGVDTYLRNVTQVANDRLEGAKQTAEPFKQAAGTIEKMLKWKKDITWIIIQKSRSQITQKAKAANAMAKL